MLDAVAWPGLWIVAILNAPFDMGITGQLLVPVLAMGALYRAYRALRHNERYWFTTWRWGVPIVVVTLIGVALKLLA